MFRSRTFKITLVVLAVIIIAAAAYAFAASNTIDASSAGSGVSVVSGFNVTNIAYNLNANPTIVNTITFTITPKVGTAYAKTVKVQLNDTPVTGDTTWSWVNCAVATNVDVTCTPVGTLLVTDITTLNVVATSN